MPLYEGIGLISEKHAVVIDIGNAYTKCGFAGETGPRCIIPSEVLERDSNEMVKVMNYKDEKHLYQLLVDFIHHLYFKHLLVNPKDRRAMIVESVFSPTIFRETLAKVLFVHYEVSSVLFAPAHLMALFTLGVSSALVLDVGYTETQVFPIYDGILMLNFGEGIPLAGQTIHKSLEALLNTYGKAQAFSHEGSVSQICGSLQESTLEDIKVRTCIVSTFERSQALKPLKSEQKLEDKEMLGEEFLFPVDGEKILHVPKILRELAPEVLFDLDNDVQSIATVVLDSVLKSPIDMRRTLAENILIIGGTAMMPGFKSRLKTEINKLLSHPKYKTKCAIRNFRFHKPPAQENYAAWLGAAIFGATDVITTRSLTREQYFQQNCVPDWSNLAFSCVQDEEKSI